MNLKLLSCLAFVLFLGPATEALAQKAAPPLLTRTTTRCEARKLGFASTLTLLGGPSGNITIEGWNKPEIEIVADIEVKAAGEEDLNRLMAVNNFVLDEGFSGLSIITTGAHDKDFIKKHVRDFPKKLIGGDWRIDYKLKVPLMTDLDINGGRGAVSMRGVEGTIFVKTLEGDADLTLNGGFIRAVIGRGAANVKIVPRSWRGAGVDIQLANGNLNVTLPPNFSGDVDAQVLRTGILENLYEGLLPRERTTPTLKSLQGRSGAGGPRFGFTVGDGVLRLQPIAKTAP